MVKISKRPLRQAQTEQDNEVIGDIFQSLAASNPTGQTDQTEPAQTEKQPDLTALLERISSLEGRLQERDREASYSLYTQPATNQFTAPDASRSTMAELPDPFTNPVEYAAAVRDQTLAEIRRERDADNDQRTRQAQAEQQSNALWENFKVRHADIAEDPERLEFAMNRVTNKLRSRGVDVARYAQAAQTKLIDEVAEEYTNIFGEPDETEVEPAPRRRGRPRKVADEPSRTDGIFGGMESGHRPTNQRPSEGDMIQDLRALQQKSGLF